MQSLRIGAGGFCFGPCDRQRQRRPHRVIGSAPAKPRFADLKNHRARCGDGTAELLQAEAEKKEGIVTATYIGGRCVPVTSGTIDLS